MSPIRRFAAGSVITTNAQRCSLAPLGAIVAASTM
jgi:hypothetical protein